MKFTDLAMRDDRLPRLCDGARTAVIVGRSRAEISHLDRSATTNNHCIERARSTIKPCKPLHHNVSAPGSRDAALFAS
jgi:transcriptional regulator